MKYTCFVKDDKLSHQCYQAIATFLNAYGWQHDEAHPQLVITIGGDGTVLAAIHQYLNQLNNVAFVGIHTGSLGFFNDYRVEEIKDFIQDLITKKPQIEAKQMLKAVIDNDERQTVYALNEVRVENNLKTQILQVNIDNVVFEVLRGSGVCLSTQAGSTAYNRSLGGAVLDEQVWGIQMSEIVTIHNSRFHSLGSPMVINPRRTVTIVAQDFNYSVLCYDHKFFQLQGRKQISCQLSEKVAYFAHYKDTDYLKRIQTLF